jgi:hypothetical protein
MASISDSRRKSTSSQVDSGCSDEEEESIPKPSRVDIRKNIRCHVGLEGDENTDFYNNLRVRLCLRYRLVPTIIAYPGTYSTSVCSWGPATSKGLEYTSCGLEPPRQTCCWESLRSRKFPIICGVCFCVLTYACRLQSRSRGSDVSRTIGPLMRCSKHTMLTRIRMNRQRHDIKACIVGSEHYNFTERFYSSK